MGYGTKKFSFFSYLSCNELKEYASDLSHSALAQVPLLPKREKNLWHKTLIEEKTWLGEIEVLKIIVNALLFCRHTNL